jgi:hypothetical protein
MAGTRSGLQLTGTIAVVYWPILGIEPGESVAYVDNPVIFYFPFTAVRMR